MIPRLGGLGMFVAFVAVVTAIAIVQPGPVAIALVTRAAKLWPFMAGMMIMHAIGLLDDLKSQPARLKLAVQIVAALLVVLSGYRFRGFGFQADMLSDQLSWLSVVISVGWIVGVANAINFIDGLDGLAGSLSFIAAFAFGIYYYRVGDAPSSLLCLCIAGVVVGFLFFNLPLPKAKLFMGDSGSLFLGFCLAVMPFLGQANGAVHRISGPGLFPSITVLALPVFDAVRTMALRVSQGKNPMAADRQHVHFLFADGGYSSRVVLVLLDGMAIVLATMVLIASSMPQSLGYMLELIAIGFLCILFRYAQYVGAAKAER
jgi:UDP-GlcNAc:undecaprenyl-phosphate GlcNAc-1-phosphate transferase